MGSFGIQESSITNKTNKQTKKPTEFMPDCNYQERSDIHSYPHTMNGSWSAAGKYIVSP